MWVSLIQSTEGLNRTKGRGRIHSHSCALTLQALCLPACLPELGHQSSPALGLGLYHQLSWTPACRKQIMGLLSLQHWTTQFLCLNANLRTLFPPFHLFPYFSQHHMSLQVRSSAPLAQYLQTSMERVMTSIIDSQAKYHKTHLTSHI